MARIMRTKTEFQETASPAVVSWYSVVPALMATKDGGATPGVENQKGRRAKEKKTAYQGEKKGKKKSQISHPTSNTKNFRLCCLVLFFLKRGVNIKFKDKKNYQRTVYMPF